MYGTENAEYFGNDKYSGADGSANGLPECTANIMGTIMVVAAVFVIHIEINIVIFE
ncbi:unnamed protein product [Spodoptera exigua]|nr:unnamed protein product [Spodoptera exigua]